MPAPKTTSASRPCRPSRPDGVRRILAADIGGTNCRFGHFTLKDGGLALARAEHCPTALLRRTEDALRAAAQTGLAPEEADVTVWAVAGPVEDDLRVAVTNAALRLDLRPLAASGAHVRLINDFAALAWAGLAPPGEDALPVLPGKILRGVRGVLGAGTGLGAAVLLPEPHGGWRVLCAEAGHVAFAFQSRQEMEYGEFLRTRHGAPYATAEHVLSGRGIELLHSFLTGEEDGVERIAAARLQNSGTPECPGHPTLRWFARFYGRMCRHWALSTLSTGGFYVGGGVARKNPALVLAPEFAEEFYDVPSHLRPVMRRMAVRLIRHDFAGLWGAARVGQAMLEDRAWTRNMP